MKIIVSGVQIAWMANAHNFIITWALSSSGQWPHHDFCIAAITCSTRSVATHNQSVNECVWTLCFTLIVHTHGAQRTVICSHRRSQKCAALQRCTNAHLVSKCEKFTIDTYNGVAQRTQPTTLCWHNSVYVRRSPPLHGSDVFSETITAWASCNKQISKFNLANVRASVLPISCTSMSKSGCTHTHTELMEFLRHCCELKQDYYIFIIMK